MLNPTHPGRAGAGQCRGVVTGLGARGSFSTCRPQWDLSSLIEHEAGELACTVCSPSHGVPEPCAAQPDGSAATRGAAM